MADHALATVTNPSSALTDFTLIVDLANMPASWWSAVDTSDGTRGRVYKGDGTTRLAADWIDFDDTAETGLLRVLWSGTLATSGTQQLWIEPPVSTNAAVAASDTYGSDNAYDSSWGTYHADGGYSTTDRTANANNGTLENSPGSSPSTKIGAVATTFNGNNQAVNLGTDTSIRPTSAITVMAWTYPTSRRTDSAFAMGGFSGGFLLGYDTGSAYRGYVYTSAWRNVQYTYTSLNAWSHHAVAYDGSTLTVYANNSSSTGSYSGSISHDAVATRIGGYWNSGSSEPKSFWGRLQEFQIHTTARSSAWIDTEYDQTNDNSTFWGTWSWETSGGGTTYNVSASDGVSLSDSPSGTLTIAASATDGASLSDAPSGVLLMQVAAADGLAMADAPTGPLTIAQTIADGISLADAASGAFTFRVATADGVTFADAASDSGGTLFAVTVADGISLADSSNAVLELVASIADGITLTDAGSSTATINAVVNDGVSFSDAVSTALAILASVTDGIKLSDVSIDSTFLPVGQVRVTVTSAQASVSITYKQAGVTVASKQAGVTVTTD